MLDPYIRMYMHMDIYIYKTIKKAKIIEINDDSHCS